MQSFTATQFLRLIVALSGVVIYGSQLHAQQPFLSETQWIAIRDEASGKAPYENLRTLTRLHRVPATPEFDQAADFILMRAKEYGLEDARREQFPIDRKSTRLNSSHI